LVAAPPSHLNHIASKKDPSRIADADFGHERFSSERNRESFGLEMWVRIHLEAD
jgi:hypothetical protein